MKAPAEIVGLVQNCPKAKKKVFVNSLQSHKKKIASNYVVQRSLVSCLIIFISHPNKCSSFPENTFHLLDGDKIATLVSFITDRISFHF